MRCLLLSCLLVCAHGALAGRLEIPLRVSLATIRQALTAQLAASSARPNEIYREGRCRYLNLEQPKLDTVEGQLHLTGPGSAAFGMEMFGNCQNAAAWQGTMQFTLTPWLDPAGRLRLRIVDSKLTDAAGGKPPALGFIWDLSKRYLHPRLERFSYDLGASREGLVSIVRGAAPPEHSAEMEQALAQLQVMQPRIETAAVVVPIAVEIPDVWMTPAPAATVSTAPLTEAELDALDRALQPWDAFIVYSIKQVALDSEDSALRKRLFTLLLDSRYRLAAILSGEESTAGDPLRALFVDSWNELRTILADAQRDGVLDTSPLRYAAFIDTGDALLALDRWVPTREELGAYETRVGELLQKTSAAELQRANLAAPYDKIYRSMVPTTALIESCWRQYVLRGGKVSYLRSGAGSVGIMQINQVVWRGFYEIERLRWETAYNARAGAQIVLRYMKDYAIPYAERSGDANHIPRATYAVYNAGPRAVGRFNKPQPHPREQRVDERLWKIYRGIASGGQADLRACGVDTAAASLK